MTIKKATQLPAGVESLDDVARHYIAQKKRDKAEEAVKATKRVAQPVDGNDDGDPEGQHSDGPAADELFDDLTGNDDPNADGDDGDSEDGDEDLKPDAVGGRVDTATIERSLPAPEVSYYAPITRIDKKKREVIGTATAEIKDAYKTVIGFEASKEALTKWPGNIREMHDPKTAVGRALEVTPDPDHKRVIVRARISKGAEDTWQKVLDGTLTGFSIGGRNGKWTTRVIDGEELPYLERYDAVELSLVDNPACPGCTIEVVRADGMASEVLATEQEMNTTSTKKPEPAAPDIERKSVQISAANRDKVHASRDALTSMCADAGCEDCMADMNKAAENDDKDGDMDPPSRRVIADIVREALAEALRDQVAPVLSRVNALLASDAQRSDESPEITRRVDGIDAQLAAIKALVEEIHSQPTDGGPVLHGGGPVDKVLATQAGNASRATDASAIQRALEMGFAPPTELKDQLKAATSLISAGRAGR